jgi:hypothetical protein
VVRGGGVCILISRVMNAFYRLYWNMVFYCDQLRLPLPFATWRQQQQQQQEQQQEQQQQQQQQQEQKLQHNGAEGQGERGAATADGVWFSESVFTSLDAQRDRAMEAAYRYLKNAA